MSIKSKITKANITPIIFSVLTMLLIFVFSSQSGASSGSLSIKVTRFIAGIIFTGFEAKDEWLQNLLVSELHAFVRKAAHFTVYAFLGFNVFLSVRVYFAKLGRQLLAALIFCAAYACFDEFRQLFIPGRAGSFTDVLIDTLGAVFGIIAGLLLVALKKYLKPVNKV